MDIIDKFCFYFEENRVVDFLSLFHTNSTYIDCLYGTFTGIKEIEFFFKKCHKEASNYKFKPINKILNNNLASFEWEFSFVSNMPLSDGKNIFIKGCSFITMNNNKIESYRDYADSVLFLIQGNVPAKKIVDFYNKKLQRENYVKSIKDFK